MRKTFSLSPFERNRKRLKIFKKKVLRAISKLSEDDPAIARILALLGVEDRSALLLSSDLKALSEVSDYLAKLMLEMRTQFPDRRMFHLTLLDDSGNTSDRAPVIDIRGLQAKAGRALRSIGLEGLVVVEVHPLANYPQGGDGRTLMFHIHAIAWTDEPFDPDEAEALLIGGSGWKCSMGAPPVVIQTVEGTDEDIEKVARYVVKPPHAAKNRQEKKKQRGKFRLLNTIGVSTGASTESGRGALTDRIAGPHFICWIW